MARPNKKHHKIPATYLESFTDINGRLWVADREFHIYSQTPRGLLTENDYYTIRFPDGGGTILVETKYLGGIEGNYADLYRSKIAQRELLTKEDKAKMSVFVASMMARQPVSRLSWERFFNDAKELVEHMEAIPVEKRRNIAKLMPSSSGSSIPAKDFLEAGKDVGSLHTSLIPHTVKGIAPVIFKMHWAFAVRSADSKPFLTSDNPCVLVNAPAENKWGKGTMGSSPGLIQEDVDLTLPLSSDIALVCGWHYKGDCEYLPISTDHVDEINRRTSRHADVIIGSDKVMLENIMNRIKKRLADKGMPSQ